ncbi:hypothetical protein C8R44DRAFT_786845 [Mycena epipterygia]|nr:hypothetical protein C8R44DRAFT_786845 [Mycena epipterygia]
MEDVQEERARGVRGARTSERVRFFLLPAYPFSPLTASAQTPRVPYPWGATADRRPPAAPSVFALGGRRTRVLRLSARACCGFAANIPTPVLRLRDLERATEWTTNGPRRRT